MSEKKLPFWADALLTCWVVLVGLIYFVPALGALAGRGAVVYALMVLISSLVLAHRYLRRAESEA